MSFHVDIHGLSLSFKMFPLLQDTFEIQKNPEIEGAKFIIVDDLLATGGMRPESLIKVL